MNIVSPQVRLMPWEGGEKDEQMRDRALHSAEMSWEDSASKASMTGGYDKNVTRAPSGRFHDSRSHCAQGRAAAAKVGQQCSVDLS